MDGDRPYETISRDTDLRDTVVNQANHITRLEVENRHFRAQLKKQDAPPGFAVASSNISGGSPSTPVTTAQLNDPMASAGADNSSTSFDELGRKYKDLVTEHQQLTAKYNEQKQWVDYATMKYKAAKAAITEWKRYIESQKSVERVRAANTGPRLREMSPSDRVARHDDNITPRARPIRSQGFHGVSSQHEDDEHQPAELNAELPSGCPQAEDGNPTSGSQSVTRVVDLAASSQTTEGDTETSNENNWPPEAPCEQSDDEPQVVSARSLKRKKPSTPGLASPPRRIKREPSSQNRLIEINSEDYSSPPKACQTLVRTETSDLTTTTYEATTPHKRSKLNDVTHRARSEELPNSNLHLDHDASLSDGGVQHHPRRKCEIHSPVLESAQQGLARELPAVRARNIATAQPGVQRDALMPLSNNLPTSPHAQAPRSGRGKMYRMAAIVSEDGAVLSSQVPGLVDDQPPKTNKQHNERLDDMLGPGAEAAKPVLKPRQAIPIKTPASASVTPPPAANPPHESRINRKHAPAEASPPPVKPEDEPLRLRSANQLRLEDFKVNSKYMGSSFAFAESLRKRDQKRCAPGCTNPACCGTAFRDLAAIGGSDLFGTNKKTKNDADLLEDYLGPEWEANVGALSPEQREETLINARAYALSNQHGKHRQAFERRSTPPGFWRTDFPSTQETLEDRARAHEMLRLKVEERYREAMRPGGRWKFRDE